MNYRLEQQQQMGDVTIIGVSRHQHTVSGWADFSASLSVPIDEWMKTGDIQLKKGALTVLPTATGRILCVGLDHRKQLSEADIDTIFEAVGALMIERKWSCANVMLETFFMPQFSKQMVASHILSAIRYGSYTPYGYQTSSNEADVSIDELIFITDERLELADAHRESEQLAVWRAYEDEPVNVLTAAHIEERIIAYCHDAELACQVLTLQDLEALGFGAALMAYEEDVRVLLVNTTLEAQHAVVGAFAVGDTMPLFSSVEAVVTAQVMGVFAIGTLKAILPNKHVITTMIGKTIELAEGALASDLALVDVLAFAATQHVQSVTTVSTLSEEGQLVFGDTGSIAYTNGRMKAPEADLVVQAAMPKPSALADALLKRYTKGRVMQRAALYRLFAPALWVHLELPHHARKQQVQLGQLLRNLIKED